MNQDFIPHLIDDTFYVGSIDTWFIKTIGKDVTFYHNLLPEVNLQFEIDKE